MNVILFVIEHAITSALTLWAVMNAAVGTVTL